jgi:hypothetical protein
MMVIRDDKNDIGGRRSRGSHLNPKGERHHGQDEEAGDESGKFHGAAGFGAPGVGRAMACPVVPAVAALATVIWRVVASLVAGGGGGERGLMVASG